MQYYVDGEMKRTWIDIIYPDDVLNGPCNLPQIKVQIVEKSIIYLDNTMINGPQDFGGDSYIQYYGSRYDTSYITLSNKMSW